MRALLLALLLPACAEPTFEDLMNATNSCDAIGGGMKLATDAGADPTVQICELEGAIWWRADFDVDCDGALDEPCLSADSREPTTSAVDQAGEPLSASLTPFVTVPMPDDTFDYTDQDTMLGSVVAVLWKGKMVFAPIGNEGTSGIIGEGSWALAEKLGLNSDPVDGGIDRGVTFIVFTGDDTVVTPVDSESSAESIGMEQAAELLKEN